MLFNSYLYIFIFLPITLSVFFFVARRAGETTAICWLIAMSFVFYAWWNPAYVPLLAGSILFNYWCGRSLQNADNRHIAGAVLVLGITCNLLLLGYFKYAGFFAGIANALSGTEFLVGEIMLPLAISFFTFQQIAYLVDGYKKIVTSSGFLRYCLFITFFPQLIAGPIVHHKEMMPQFQESRIFCFLSSNLALGSAIFIVGLFKKVVIGDSLDGLVTPAFSAAELGENPGFYSSWLAAFAFSLQVYFDFSGYTDMAIGSALMIGIQLPVNFFSPYKAASISELWRRWHMTLTRFITEYIFTPISHKLARLSLKLASNTWLLLILASVIPLIITFVLVGLWHGAGWNFVLFGLYQGLLLSLHALWQQMKRAKRRKFTIPKSLSVALTLLAWVWGVVLFRADSLTGITAMYAAMLDISSLSAMKGASLYSAAVVVVLYGLTLILPNTEQLFHQHRPRLSDKSLEKLRISATRIYWKESIPCAIFFAALFFTAMVFMTRKIEFIYFQF
jgi:alginate O-acetyltransferase complex protein AlgI